MPAGPYNAKEHVLSSIDQSLDMLSVRKIDILQLHENPKRLLTDPLFWEGINASKKAGKVGLFGISVYEPSETLALIEKYGARIDLLQIPYSIFDQRFESLFDQIEQKGLGVIARSIFLKGMIAAKKESVPEELAGLEPCKAKSEAISKKERVSIPHLALRYVLDASVVMATIVGVESVAELEANTGALARLDHWESIRSELSTLGVSDHHLIDPRQWKQF